LTDYVTPGIITVMEMYQTCPKVRRFVKASKKEWKTEMWLYHIEGHIKTGKVAIKREIFQGDSLSLLLFCLALIPLTNMLNKQGAGYKVKKKIKSGIISI